MRMNGQRHCGVLIRAPYWPCTSVSTLQCSCSQPQCSVKTKTRDKAAPIAGLYCCSHWTESPPFRFAAVTTIQILASQRRVRITCGAFRLSIFRKFPEHPSCRRGSGQTWPAGGGTVRMIIVVDMIVKAGQRGRGRGLFGSSAHGRTGFVGSGARHWISTPRFPPSREDWSRRSNRLLAAR